jgi:hypothetical protein
MIQGPHADEWSKRDFPILTPTPVEIYDHSRIVKFQMAVCGRMYTLLLDVNERVWGAGKENLLGINSTGNTYFCKLPFFENIKYIAGRGDRALLIKGYALGGDIGSEGNAQSSPKSSPECSLEYRSQISVEDTAKMGADDLVFILGKKVYPSKFQDDVSDANLKYYYSNRTEEHYPFIDPKIDFDKREVEQDTGEQSAKDYPWVCQYVACGNTHCMTSWVKEDNKGKVQDSKVIAWGYNDKNELGVKHGDGGGVSSGGKAHDEKFRKDFFHPQNTLENLNTVIFQVEVA